MFSFQILLHTHCFYRHIFAPLQHASADSKVSCGLKVGQFVAGQGSIIDNALEDSDGGDGKGAGAGASG